MRGSVDALLVVVPAHDEEAVLGRCLDHLVAAVDQLGPAAPEVRTVVVLDGCTDRTAAIARQHPVEVVGCTARTVGRARAVGVLAARRPSDDPRRTWVATTDADSRVPVGWLAEHLAAAHSAADLLLGPVLPDPDELADGLLRRWLDLHPRSGAHVHGANLGVRLSTYLAAGGFPPLACGEDVALVDAVRALGGRVVTGRSRVVTSARTQARTPNGFAAYLRRMSHDVAQPASA